METLSKEAGARYKREHKQRLRDAVSKIKSEQGCAICGYNKHPAALQFDHLDPTTKEFNVGSAVSNSFGWSRIQAEIEKCRVLCANCHAIHSYDNLPRGQSVLQLANTTTYELKLMPKLKSDNHGKIPTNESLH